MLTFAQTSKSIKMNKFKILYFALPLLVACSSESVDLKIDDAPQQTASTTIRSVDDALIFAEQASNLLEPTSRSARAVCANDIYVATSAHSRSHNVKSDTLYYVINYEDDMGCAIISANPTLPPILGVTEKGSSKDLLDTENQGAQLIMTALNNYVTAESAIIPIDPPIGQLPITPWFVTDTIYVFQPDSKRLKVNWGQDWPENIYCENHFAGCGPIAVAQMITYLESLNGTINLTFPLKDQKTLTLNWDEIRKHGRSGHSATDYQNCTASEEAHKNIGRFVRQIGQVIGTDYVTYSYGSGTLLGSIMAKFNSVFHRTSYVYGCNFIEGETVELYNRLNSDCIALISGNIPGYSFQHLWVVDGRAKIGYRVIDKKWVAPSDGIGSGYWEEIDCREEVYENYLHHNWGWRGYSNGYFLESLISPSEGCHYDYPGDVVSEDYPQVLIEYFIFKK